MKALRAKRLKLQHNLSLSPLAARPTLPGLGHLELGFWSFSGAWSLGFGAFDHV
jgi:hypothetical protein